MLSLNLTATLGTMGVPLTSAIAQSVVHDPSARLTKRYSALARPIACKRNLDAGADCPAGFDCAANGIVGEVRPDIAKGGAAGAVDKEAIERIAGAAAHGAEPTVLLSGSLRHRELEAVKVPKPLASAQSPSASTPNTSDPTW